MNIFIAIFEEAVEASTLISLKQKHGDNFYQLNNRVLLIRSIADDPLTISRQLEIGQTPESSEPSIGVVLKLNGSHAGHYYPALWDWLVETRTLSGV